MAVTDLLIPLVSIIFLFRGAARGFINSLIPPFSIIVASIFSIIYYKVTDDMIASLLIGLIGPLLLSLLLKFILRTWIAATNSKIKPGYLSRLGGALLTLLWGWVLIIFILILFAILPPWGNTLTVIHNDVEKSASYWIAQHLEETFFSPPQQAVAAVASDAASSDAKSLAEDPLFQKILQDPDIQKDINTHDMVKLMSNPKMMDLVHQIMSNPATMKKVMNIYNKQAQSQENKF